ncbi:MAG: hypothetical protein ACYC43_01135 [Burkholderiales bacterium]
MFNSTLSLFIITVLLSACASRPESISASYVPYQKYTDGDCARLATQRSEAEANLAKVSDMQNSKANGDAVGVFLIGVPFSKLSGDYAGEVARCKGEVEAIDTAQTLNKCKGVSLVSAPQASIPNSPIKSRSTNEMPEKYSYVAEVYAKGQGCLPNASALLIGRGPGYETYTIACENGESLPIRCDFGTCRVLK